MPAEGGGLAGNPLLGLLAQNLLNKAKAAKEQLNQETSTFEVDDNQARLRHGHAILRFQHASTCLLVAR